MSSPGAPDAREVGTLMVAARAAMLDALEALAEHRGSVIVIGAQAVYLRTGQAQVALAEATKDSDLAIDPQTLRDDPLVEAAMTAGGFLPDPTSGQPGAWVSPAGVPVDLMVPEALAGPGAVGTRGARLPPHSRRAMRRARGLEAVLVDNTMETVRALDDGDRRAFDVRVAGPAALIVAKAHKIAERRETPHRLNDKDAHDLYRILVAISTENLASAFRRLLQDPVCANEVDESLAWLAELAAAGPQAMISMMAGRAELGIGEPETVSLATSILADDLLSALDRR